MYVKISNWFIAELLENLGTFLANLQIMVYLSSSIDGIFLWIAILVRFLDFIWSERPQRDMWEYR